MIGLDAQTRKLIAVEPIQARPAWDECLEWCLLELSFEEGDMTRATGLVPLERIERHILWIRGEKVLLDSDLATLYGVSTKVLNQAVKRNRSRFPNDFMFQLSAEEADALRSQSVTLNRGQHRKYRPYAFTEQGVAMLSSVLRSERAVQVNVQIMRTFVRLRQMLASNAALSKRLDELERRYDKQFRSVFDAIRALMAEPDEENIRPRIGYSTEDRERHRQTTSKR